MNGREKILKFLKSLSWEFWVLLAIIALGIFLRAYNFHDWLRFETDQVRDAAFVRDILAGEKSWPLLGPTMRASGETKEVLFRIGPVYYYFQLVSSMIFGVSASAMAYPDLLFSILSIPLFYYFMRKYFSVNISLGLVFLFSVSFFAIKYARFAWNPNSIPFFVLLFLLSVHHFLTDKEKVSWKWVAAAGIAVGVGIQLHAIALISLLVSSAVISIYLLKENRKVWKKLLVVLILVMFINIPQLISEFRTGFANSRAMLNSSVIKDESQKKSILAVVADNVSCSIEFNEFALSSMGGEECISAYRKVLQNNKAGIALRAEVSWSELILVLLFSALGYLLLVYNFFVQKDKNKKSFLVLVIIFSLIFSATMFPIIKDGFREFRYFNAVFFLPFVLLGLLLDFAAGGGRKVFLVVAVCLGVLLVATNAFSLFEISSRLTEHKGNNGHAVFLGEVESVLEYMKEVGGVSDGKIYLMSDRNYAGNIFLPGAYVAKQSGLNLIEVSTADNAPKGISLFYVSKNRGDAFDEKVGEDPVKNAKNFGEMRIYQLAH